MGIKTDSTPIDEPKNTNSCNVFNLYKLLSNDKQIEGLQSKYESGGIGYGQAKQELFELICEKFSEERKKFNYLMENKAIIDEKLQSGAKKAKLIAKDVLKRVRSNIGYQ